MPPIICPCCRASNTAGPTCRRCSADLSLMFKLEEDREALLAAARYALANWQPADALLAHAELLRAGDDVRQLRAVACLLKRDFAGALANGTA